MSKIVETKWLAEDRRGRLKRYPVVLEYTDNNRINVVESDFVFKDEIKAMQGSRCEFKNGVFSHWHFDNSQRNRFQMDWLEGQNPYEWFERDLIEHDYPTFGNGVMEFTLHNHQKNMADNLLTYHFHIFGAEMGVGKTGAAIAAAVLSGKKGFWWVGPKSSIYNIRKEFEEWGVPDDLFDEIIHYELFVEKMRTWKSGNPAPIGVIFDEAHRLKSPSAQRTGCAQAMADAIRAEYGHDGYVCLMTGTPSPKNPADWWALCEIAYPGFLKEGDKNKLEKRLGFYRTGFNPITGQHYPDRVGWRDDPNRCAICGKYEAEGNHIIKGVPIMADDDPEIEPHAHEQSENEVALMHSRLKGLATIIHKKDVLDLPQKVYKVIHLEPTPSLLRVASVISKAAPTAIQGLNDLRQLSDGFQYREVEDGFQACDICEDGTVERFYHPNDPEATIHSVDLLSEDFVAELEKETAKCPKCKGTQKVTKYKRITKEVPCPKEDAVVDLLDQEFEQRRIVFFAGFRGALDRVTRVCQREGWDTMRVDGSGWRIERLVGKPKKNSQPETEVVKLDNPMDYWTENPDRKIAFVAHPKSGGVSLTLCEKEGRPGAKLACFYSNDYDPASRAQAEDRIDRLGMLHFATIVDLFHLPTDERVLEVLRMNRKLELMTMGDFEAVANDYAGVAED